MKKNMVLLRILFVGVWLLMHGMLVLFAIGMYQESVLAEGWVLLVMMSVLWTAVALMGLIAASKVTLAESGIDVKRLWARRHYAWDEIIQAGILQVRHRYGFYNGLFLLRTGGSPRRYQDKTFQLRNGWYLIEAPNTEENRHLVRKYYGPLDFDLTDGRPEKSEVVEAHWEEDVL